MEARGEQKAENKVGDVTKETHKWEKAKVIKKDDSYWKKREKTFKNYSYLQ
jgi:hypothetical protein